MYYGISESDEQTSTHFELRPKPPPGVFDARFASGAMVVTPEQNGARDFPIIVSGTEYPVTIAIAEKAGSDGAKLLIMKGVEGAGYRSVQWDARGIPSGVYFYRLTAGNFTAVKKMLLVR